MSRRSYDQYCALARALDALGERWTLLLVRELFGGPRRFADLETGLPGIGTNLLSARLKRLAELDVVRKRDDRRYELTDRGRALEPALVALGNWGLDLLGPATEVDTFVASWLPLALRIRFRPDKSAGLDETYEYEVDGETFHVRVNDGTFTAAPGPAPAAAFTLRADGASLAAVAEGTLSVDDALTSGRWQLEGSRAALRRSLRLFPPS